MKKFIVLSMILITNLCFSQIVMAANEVYSIKQVREFKKSDSVTYYDFEYNFKGLLSSETERTDLTNVRKFEFEYDENNFLIKRDDKNFDDDDWQHKSRTTYHYDNDKLLMREQKLWDGEYFQDYARHTFEYYDDGEIKYEKREEFVDGEWKIKYEMIYNYYTDYDQVIWYAYNNEGYISTGLRWRYLYNEFGFIWKEYQAGWYIDDWVSGSRKTYYYWSSTPQRLAEYVQERYIDSNWTIRHKVEFGYNFQDKLALEKTLTYPDSVWTNNLRRDHEYDNFGNRTAANSSHWKGTDWAIFDNTFSVDLMTGNIPYLRYFSGYRIEFDYELIVSAEEENITTTTLSPNPATDYIEINNVMLSETKHPVLNVKLYDVLGIEHPATSWHPSKEGNIRLDISRLSPGVYFVSVGGRMYKFVKM